MGFSCKSNLELLGATEGEFFCLGSYVEKGLNLGSDSEERVPLTNKCYLCFSKEESIDHILLHCELARSLWNLLFSLFGVPCFHPQLERHYWGGLSLVWERRGRKCGYQPPCAFFGWFGRKETVGLLKLRVIQFKGVNIFSFVTCGRGLRGF